MFIFSNDKRDKIHNVAIIGCGVMGQIILNRLLNHYKGDDDAIESFWCTLRTSETLERLKSKYKDTLNVHFSLDNLEALKNSNIIFLCVKPQNLEELLNANEIMDILKQDNKIVISMVAGVPLKKYNGIPIIFRIMPNVSCSVGEGMIVISHDPIHPPQREEKIKAFIEGFLRPLGSTIYLHEKFLNIATGLSGSGPAFAWYYYLFFHSLINYQLTVSFQY